jgi:hypothetical protein
VCVVNSRSFLIKWFAVLHNVGDLKSGRWSGIICLFVVSLFFLTVIVSFHVIKFMCLSLCQIGIG